MPEISEAELTAGTDLILGDDITKVPTDRLKVLITITQHLTDRLLNELEARGAIEFHEGMPIIPYLSNYSVETLLTREELPN